MSYTIEACQKNVTEYERTKDAYEDEKKRGNP